MIDLLLIESQVLSPNLSCFSFVSRHLIFSKWPLNTVYIYMPVRARCEQFEPKVSHFPCIWLTNCIICLIGKLWNFYLHNGNVQDVSTVNNTKGLGSMIYQGCEGSSFKLISSFFLFLETSQMWLFLSFQAMFDVLPQFYTVCF